MAAPHVRPRPPPDCGSAHTQHALAPTATSCPCPHLRLCPLALHPLPRPARDGSDIFSVNSIEFHPQFGTFVTAGSDGTYNFWDKDSKQRLKAMQKCQYGPDPAPIPCGAFNSDGSIYAYAVSYDWSRGFQAYNPAQMPAAIMLHATQEAEVSARRGREVGGGVGGGTRGAPLATWRAELLGASPRSPAHARTCSPLLHKPDASREISLWAVRLPVRRPAGAIGHMDAHLLIRRSRRARRPRPPAASEGHAVWALRRWRRTQLRLTPGPQRRAPGAQWCAQTHTCDLLPSRPCVPALAARLPGAMQPGAACCAVLV